MARFRRWHLAPAALLLIAAVHSLAWLVATMYLRAGLDELTRPVAGQAWRIAAGPARAGGWPAAATLDIPDFTLINAGSRTTIRASGAHVSWSPRAPIVARIAIAGPVVVDNAGAPTIEITAARAEASVALRAPYAITVTARDLRAPSPSGPVAIERFDLHATQFPAARATDIALDLDASVTGIEMSALGPALRGPFGPRIASLGLNATLSGPIDTTQPGAAAVARAWRNGGGRLTIASLNLQWSRLDVDLQATLGLDAALQPEGTGTAGAGGIPETLDRAVGEGLMPASSARAIKAVIGLMTQTPDRKITIPFSLANQTLSAARFPLLRLPDLRWP